jgi:hypothetical protein
MRSAPVAALIAVAAGFAGYWPVAVLAGLAAAVIYDWSLMHRPYIDCRACGGSKGPSSKWLGRSIHGVCRSCGGTGVKPRAGLRVFGGLRARSRARVTDLRDRQEHL